MVLIMHLLNANGAYSMLRVTTEKKRGKTALAVEGRLAGPWVGALEQCWRELHAASPTEKLHIDLCGVSFIDAAGKFLLKEIHRQGGQLIAEGCLDQAVGLALKQNPTAQIAILTAAESEQDKNIARANLLPQVNAKISDEAQKVNLLAQFGGKTPFPGFPKTLGPYQVFSAGPTFGGPVFDLTLWKRYQAARETMGASKANSLSTREQVILLVVSQYIGTLRAMANVEASQSRVSLAQALYDQAADLQKEGVGTGIDTLRANVELQNEKQRLIEAETDRETSLFALSRLLNLDPRQT